MRLGVGRDIDLSILFALRFPLLRVGPIARRARNRFLARCWRSLLIILILFAGTSLDLGFLSFEIDLRGAGACRDC